MQYAGNRRQIAGKSSANRLQIVGNSLARWRAAWRPGPNPRFSRPSPAQIRVTPVENVPATASSETTAAAVCQANSCNNHGSCISDPPSPIYCICDDGYYDGPSGYCSVSAATTAGSTVSLDAVFKDTSGSTLCSNQAAACSIAEISPSLSSSVTGKVAGLYDAATETVVLDCSVDDCTPRGTSGKVGYVTCTNVGTSCTLLVPAPMMSVSMDVTGADTPAYSKLRAYVDGKPYPRAGANTFVQSASGAYSTDLKVYSLTPGVEHTLSLVLTTDDGAPLAIKSRAFTVDFQGGCDNSCSNRRAERLQQACDRGLVRSQHRVTPPKRRAQR